MPLQLQKPAPQFSTVAVVNKEFKEVSLKSYEGQYVVLFFYPLDFTFVCPTELIAFSDRLADFEKLNCVVLAISCDSQFSHLAWINTPREEGGLGDIKLPLLADKTGKIARDFNVYNEETGIPFRGLFIIDKAQNLRQITVNDLPVGRDVDEVLRLVQAFQFTDTHGEVCPANWKPGSKTLAPTANGIKSYLKTPNGVEENKRTRPEGVEKNLIKKPKV
ncbi:peroxiredoxin 1-like [Cimex lectularius]|uniref:thioredoxin-dependent peroxiredoxin n=1 Tax=Cimex lectularius TaxID=79782 RepID=A0A8I6RXN9_CIMLE|nr:peroxiredoxin 1-like [Cimex lectularius]